MFVFNAKVNIQRSWMSRSGSWIQMWIQEFEDRDPDIDFDAENVFGVFRKDLIKGI